MLASRNTIKSLKVWRDYLMTLRQPKTALQRSRLLAYYTSKLFQDQKYMQHLMKNPPVFKYPQERMWWAFKNSLGRKVNFVGREVMVLLNSRILQFMSIVPAIYVTYKLGHQIYIEYQTIQPPLYYVRPSIPITETLKKYLVSVIGDVFRDATVEKEAQNFLSRLLLEP